MKKLKDQNNKLGVIYARYSSHSQRDVSIEQQVSECRSFAAEAGITIIDVYADRAVSGKSDQRPHFQRMMKDAEHGGFEYVIAWKSNRIGRNMMQAMVNEARLNDAGVKCLYTEEDFDDSAAGRFALRSMMNVNQFYSENMAEDIVRGLRSNAEKCMITGSIPFGYKKGEDMRYEIDAPKDEIVREIFTRVACGDPLIDIVESLNMRGISTKSGGKWNKNSFHRMLNNERYRGIYIYNDIRVEGGIPRIVTDELFFQAQEAIRTKKNPINNIKRRNSSEYLLTGKLYCGLCKHQMVGVSGKSSHGEKQPHYYYKCNNKRLNHACDKQNVPRDKIELAVANAIKDYALQDDVIEWIADSTVAHFKHAAENSDIPIIESQIADTNRSIKNIISAIEQGIITDTTKNRLMELESENTRLNAQLQSAKAEIVTVDRAQIVAGLEMFRAGDFNDKHFLQTLFDTFLVAVYLYEDKFKVFFSFAGNDNNIELPLDIDCADTDGAVCMSSPQLHHKNISSPMVRGYFYIEKGGSRKLKSQHSGGMLLQPVQKLVATIICCKAANASDSPVLPKMTSPMKRSYF